MECVDHALKSSFRPYFLVKTAEPHGFIEEFWPVNGGQSGGDDADDFSVDGFLDFSKDDGFVDDNDKDGGDSGVALLEAEKDVISNAAAVTYFVENGSLSVTDGGLCVPDDVMAELEWLSHFVDDSSPGYSSRTSTYLAGTSPDKPKSAASPLIAVSVNPSSFITPVQTKARSKRTQTGGRVWSLGSPSLTDSTTSSSSSSSCTSNPWLIYNDFSQTAESPFGKPPINKSKKKNPVGENGGGGQQPRHAVIVWFRRLRNGEPVH